MISSTNSVRNNGKGKTKKRAARAKANGKVISY